MEIIKLLMNYNFLPLALVILYAITIQGCQNSKVTTLTGESVDKNEYCSSLRATLADKKSIKEYPYDPATQAIGKRKYEENQRLDRANIVSLEKLIAARCP